MQNNRSKENNKSIMLGSFVRSSSMSEMRWDEMNKCVWCVWGKITLGYKSSPSMDKINVLSDKNNEF